MFRVTLKIQHRDWELTLQCFQPILFADAMEAISG
jgi:hypothetical protein